MFSNDFIKVFTSEDCIHQIQIYRRNKSREITFIGHNSSGFDSYLVAQHFNLEKAPLISSSKILSLTLSNPFTSVASMGKWEK